MKKSLIFLLIFLITFTFSGCKNSSSSVISSPIKAAVEYTDHAASFYCAQGNKLFEQNNINFASINLYASGVKIAAAFAQEGFDVGYMCLVPAIYTYANGGIPIKIIAGTHKNGYGLVVNTEKIKNIKDLENENIVIANGPKGTVTDFMQMLLIEKENLNQDKILSHTIRMNAAQQIMALQNRQVDAVFLPEHFATLAASSPGMKLLLTSQDVWPNMPGSVIVVSENFFQEHPEKVALIREINRQSIDFINNHPEKAAQVVSEALNINEGNIKQEMKNTSPSLKVTPQIIKASLANIKCTPEITEEEVQKIIDKMCELGYIEKSFPASQILAVAEEPK